MILFVKKVGGLVLVLLGGILAAHGGSRGETWELVIGSGLVVIGAILLAMKIVRRNPPDTGL